jgi:predicted phage baseplate assembly protein
MLRIPRYCPEWTDHNLSDPGITLIELFAWLTDQMLLRFNQVPRKNYVAFLELLGIRLQPPKPAQTDLTFYLASDLSATYTVPAGTEVATIRTEKQAAVVFSTDHDLVISIPSIKHLLTAETAEISPQRLCDPIVHRWNCSDDGEWNGPQQHLFDERPQVGNCFYLVFDADQSIEGNVLAIAFKGVAGTPTGIDPNHPPRRWEAWDGEVWRSVLLKEVDDATKGFSFHGLKNMNQPLKADVILHLPQSWHPTTFATYHGRWLRCVFSEPSSEQQPYTHSPWITGLSARSIGGTVAASQCKVVVSERLGISSGKPGQTFQLQGIPILERDENEYLLVEPPNGMAQRWEEVSDFADSTPQSRHYKLDSLTGVVQFGPLIREPNSLRYQTQVRARIQQLNQKSQTSNRISDAVGNMFDNLMNNTSSDAMMCARAEGLEHQYGAIPPVGSEIRMVRYRTGGGRQGNVQAHTLQFLQAAVPFIERVTNHQAARNGTDAESLDQAVLRVPQFLRTRDRAVTAEDFETLTHQVGAVARVHCLTPPDSGSAGTVRLLVVPQANLDEIEQGIHPSQFELNLPLRQRILKNLDERRLLGIQVQLAEPNYVGVSVQVQVGLEPAYNHPQAQQAILSQIRTSLYRFLNPITGGVEGTGWSFGRPLYPSDIVALLQQTSGIRFIGSIVLYAFHKNVNGWERDPSLVSSPVSFIDPGALGLICSWADEKLRTGHVVSLIREQESPR